MIYQTPPSITSHEFKNWRDTELDGNTAAMLTDSELYNQYFLPNWEWAEKRLKPYVNRNGLAGDSSGSYTDLITVTFNNTSTPTFIQLLKQRREADNVLQRYAHPNSINSVYDCTGLPFGSSFKIIHSEVTDAVSVWVFVHSFGIDV